MSERLLTEDDGQLAKLNLDNLLEFMPGNAQKCKVNYPKVCELHVVPLFQASLKITDDILEATKQLLFPDNQDALMKANKSMGIFIDDGGVQRYSIRGARSFFHNVCPVLVKRDGSITCACQTARVTRTCC